MLLITYNRLLITKKNTHHLEVKTKTKTKTKYIDKNKTRFIKLLNATFQRSEYILMLPQEFLYLNSKIIFHDHKELFVVKLHLKGLLIHGVAV